MTLLLTKSNLVYLCFSYISITWVVDYIYGVVFMTHSLEVVEFVPLPEQSGVQMLWRNPSGFQPRSGQFVKVQLPWLKHGGDEWHPFSIYLRESTEVGLNTIIDAESNFGADDRMVHLDFDETFDDYIEKVLTNDFEEKLGPDGTRINNGSTKSFNGFIERALSSELEKNKTHVGSSLIRKEARQYMANKYATTQIFISPAGDWSKNLMQEIEDQQQLRACWVRGPYTSPYTVSQSFSHLILTASGIGITPALGVMGQYPGLSRTKILIWSTRCPHMLKFFSPLINDAHIAIVFYTGKEKLSSDEVKKMESKGRLFIQQSRPKSFTATIGKVMLKCEHIINQSIAETLDDIDPVQKAAWCVLYCGGSEHIRKELQQFSAKCGVGFESEVFDW